MSTALVGVGYWGSKLLRNLQGIVGSEQLVVVEADPRRRATVEREQPHLRLRGRLEECLARDDVDTVVVATPAMTHEEVATTALRAGKHVLVEKPLADSAAAARRLVDIADDEGVTLMVGHTFLFSPGVELMRELADKGELGRLQYATSSRLNLGLYRGDVNVVWDLAPHDISILAHVMGEFPSTVQTTTASMVHPDVEDVAFLTLTFPSGAIASVSLSWQAPLKTRSTVLVGDKRMVVFDESQVEEPVKIYDRGVVTEESASFAANRLTYRFGDTLSPLVPAREPLRAELEHFLECARTGRTPRSSGRFGMQVVAVLEAAARSAASGNVPVEVSSVGGAGTIGTIDLRGLEPVPDRRGA